MIPFSLPSESLLSLLMSKAVNEAPSVKKHDISTLLLLRISVTGLKGVSITIERERGKSSKAD